MELCHSLVVAASLAASSAAAAQSSPPDARAEQEQVAVRDFPSDAPLARATQLLAERLGCAPSQLRPISYARPRALQAARGAHAFKFASPGGSVHAVALDDAGEEFDLRAALDLALALEQARTGPIEASLESILARAEPDARLPVVLWLASNETPALARPSPDELRALQPAAGGIDSLLAAVDADRAARSERACRDALEQLRALDPTARRDELAPAIFARLTPAQVREVARLPGVLRIGFDGVQHSELDSARGTIRADVVQSRGIRGAGVKLAQVEVGGRVRPPLLGSILSGVVQDGAYICSNSSDHATAVADVIASRHNNRRGIAPDASLWAGGSCGGITSELLDRSSAAQTWGARALNLSWGSDTDLALTTTDRFYDDAALFGWRTVIKSAGNRGALDGDVTSPGLAYNVLTVGAFNDRGNSKWSWYGFTPPDAMSSFSSWGNPLSAVGDRKKPEVVAPGENIKVPLAKFLGMWISGKLSGTSLAAPMASGAAGLLMDRDPALEIWPEGVRAILMASATHNLESGALHSERDGEGALVLDLADDIARGANGAWGGMSYSCSTAVNFDATSLSLIAGQTVRVAIAWNNDPAYANYDNEPCADIDLTILDPSNAFAAGYGSFDDTYETLEFTAAQTGTYTLRLHQFRCSSTPHYLAWAWCVR